MKSQAVALSMVRSQSLARRRDLPSHANVRSTTQRRGKMDPSKNLSEFRANDDSLLG
jgi:hypothetical protein